MFERLHLSRPTGKQRAQALVEFSLTALIFLLLLFMIIELARIMYTFVNLQHAARTGARYAVTGRWMESYATNPKGHFVVNSTNPLERIPPCWPRFPDDALTGARMWDVELRREDALYEPYRDARTCSIEHVVIGQMMGGLTLNPNALRNRPGYYQVIVWGTGEPVDPLATWTRGSSAAGGPTYPPQTLPYRRVDGQGRRYYQSAPPTGFQLIAGYGGIPEGKVVIQTRYCLELITPILNSIARQVCLDGTSVMTNEPFGSLGLNREAILPPELPPIPEIEDPNPPNLVIRSMTMSVVRPMQANTNYTVRLRVQNTGDFDATPVRVRVYYSLRDMRLGSIDFGQLEEFGTSDPPDTLGAGITQEYTVVGQVRRSEYSGRQLFFYAMVDPDNEVDERGLDMGLDFPQNEQDNMYKGGVETLGSTADLAISVTVSNSTPLPNELVTFTARVTNNGASTATGAVISHTVFGGSPTSPYRIGTIAPGASVDVPFTYRAPLSGSPSFTFRVDNQDQRPPYVQVDPNLANNSTTVRITINGVDLAIRQDLTVNGVPVPQGQEPALNPGDVLGVTITVNNLLANPASNVVVTHMRPSPAYFILSTPVASPGTWIEPQSWQIGTLSGGASATLSYTATVRSIGGVLFNSTAQVSTTTPDINTANNTSTIRYRIASADLALTMTRSVTTPRAGEQFTVSLTVTNRGPDRATDVVVNVALPAGATLVSANPTGGTSYASGVWTVGALNPGEMRGLSLIVTVDVSTPVTFGASIDHVNHVDQYDPVIANNTVTMIVIARFEINLNIRSYTTEVNGVASTTSFITDMVRFTITLSNDGPNRANNVRLTVGTLPTTPMLVGMTATASKGTYNLATGQWDVGSLEGNGTEVVTLTITARARGGASSGTPLSSLASVTGTGIETNPSNNSRSVTLTMRPLYVNVGLASDAACNQNRTWLNVLWLPTRTYTSGGWGYLNAGEALSGDPLTIRYPTDPDGQRVTICRIQDSADRRFDFRVDNLPVGIYRLVLLFVDTESTARGQRLFDATATSGTTTITLFTNLDIFIAAGGQNRALTRYVTVRIGASQDLLVSLFDPPDGPSMTPVLSGVGLEFISP